MPVLYSITLFVGAALLFLVELMFGNMILPKFGGSPAVWNTCMVFYQALLLAGYYYAHVAPQRLGVKRQALVHVGLLLVPLVSLPIAVNIDPPGDANPVWWLLLLLCLAIGLPFFVISTSAPLLTKWFSHTGHRSARDPYFLYAASNFGSMIGLILYPSILERYCSLRTQSLVWTWGYFILVGMTATCAYALWKSPELKEAEPKETEPKPASPDETAGATPPSPQGIQRLADMITSVSSLWKAPEAGETTSKRAQPDEAAGLAPTPLQRIHWIALAFVPSSLMLGVTTYLSTDISPIPLIWILPLALYLLTFIIIFSDLKETISVLVLLLFLTQFMLTAIVGAKGAGGKSGDLVGGILERLFYSVPGALFAIQHKFTALDKDLNSLFWVQLLLSSAVVATKRFNIMHQMMVLSLPVLVLLQVYLMLSEMSDSKKLLIALHLLTLFVVSMVCHGELARMRPNARYLTEFFLWMSFGGVLGGMFNALLAPVVFKTLAEYPLVLAVACLLLPNLDLDTAMPLRGRWRDFVFPGALGLLAAVVLFRVPFETVALLKNWETLEYWVKLQTITLQLAHIAMIGLATKLVLDDLARTTTSPRFLLEFMSCMIAGLVVGGAMQVPQLSTNPLWDGYQVGRWWLELPLALAFVCLLLPSVTHDIKGFRGLVLDVTVAGLFLVLVAEYIAILDGNEQAWKNVKWMSGTIQTALDAIRPERWAAPSPGRLSLILKFGLPILICYAWVTKPVRFGLGVGAILLGSAYNALNDDDVMFRERSFFGVLHIERTKEPGLEIYYNRLIHGTTLHGMQVLSGKDRKPLRDSEPLTYYHRTGPIGQVFEMLKETNDTRPVGLIGLGTGTLACYGESGQEVVFYEIDAKVLAIARDQDYFTQLDDAERRGANLNFVMGDARLSLKKDPAVDKEGRPDGHFRVIVVDAFSSDAIPKHLITLEALQLYLRKLAPDGVIAFHISNRYLDLEPVLSSLVKQVSKEEPLTCLVRHDSKEEHPGKAASTWVIIARAEHADKAFGSIREDVLDSPKDEKKRWYNIEKRLLFTKRFRLSGLPDTVVWTDDYSNILSIFIFEESEN